MTRINQLLKKIEKLEQAVKDIWASCSCLTKDLDIDLPEERDCIEIIDDFPDEPEEPEDIDICYGPEEEDPEEIIDHD